MSIGFILFYYQSGTHLANNRINLNRKITMERIENIALAYAQAPWRKQLRLVGLFSLGVVFLALLAGIYVILSANIATVGRDIQAKNYEIDDIDWQIEEMQSQLARIKSTEAMTQRARAMGFKPVEQDSIIYLPVPGYVEKQPVLLAPKTIPPVSGAVVVPQKYTETIFDWLKRQSTWLPFSMAEVLQ
jgi:hypothetical protein